MRRLVISVTRRRASRVRSRLAMARSFSRCCCSVVAVPWIWAAKANVCWLWVIMALKASSALRRASWTTGVVEARITPKRSRARSASRAASAGNWRMRSCVGLAARTNSTRLMRMTCWLTRAEATARRAAAAA